MLPPRFALKFQQMVDVEQGSNFITRLHRGSVMIVPWPVIQSRKFYALFPRIKKVLDSQPVTHPQAGVFLQTVKTLMAKLRVSTISFNPALNCTDVVYGRPMTGDRSTVSDLTLLEAFHQLIFNSRSENMASHRAHLLQNTLALALEHGATEIEPIFEPLKAS